jgi:hypothetical protein
MNRPVILALCLASLSCCGDGEKAPLPPLPKDGNAMPYTQVLARLAAQTNSAKEEHFLNHWDALADLATSLEQSAAYLSKAPDLPPLGKERFEKAAGEMQANIIKLREAARKKDQTESLELIRRLHNDIRELQDLKTK